MGTAHSIPLKNTTIHGINNAMDRKNINRGFKKAHPFVWECHAGHNGVVIPGTYKNIHGEIVTIDPKSLDPNTEVMRF
jgi:hypothetical protein